MIQITPQQRLILKVQPIDFRKGMDAIIGVCRDCFGDPHNGTIFAFRNQRATAVKLLVYDGTGFWLCLKRFSNGQLKYWPNKATDTICATTLSIILNQGMPAKMSSSWRKLPSSA